VALKPDEFDLPSIAPHPLPAIDVLTIDALPDLADSWNWAHAQVSGDAPLAEAMASAPGTAIARLLAITRQDERSLGEIHLLGDGLHGAIAETGAVGKYSELIALQRARGEDVYGDHG